MTDVIQRAFSGGEIAPSLWARTDQSKYATGLRACRNFVVHKHGGASNRAGTEFAKESKNSAKKSRLVRFKFSVTQTYVMEFGEGYIRFYQNGGVLVVTSSDAPAWSSITAYVIGNLVTSGGIRYYCILGNTNRVPPNGTYWYALTGDVYEIPTPYVEADLPGLRFTQSADVVSIVHPSHDPKDLLRYGGVSWVLQNTVFASQMAAPAGSSAVNGTAGTTVWRYKVTSRNSDTGEESEASAAFQCTGGTPTSAAPNVLTISAVSGAGSYGVYKEIIPGNGVYGWIGVAASTTFNDINIAPTSADQPPVYKTPFTGTGNRPSVVAYYQQRRVYGATLNDPEIVVASKSGLFNNLSTSTPLKDDDAVTFNLAGESVNRVVGLVGLRKLVVLTEVGEFTIEGDASGILTANGGINPSPQSYNGGADIAPLVIDSELLYVQARGNVVRSLGYEFSSDGYKGDDITLYATHLFEGKTIVDWAYSQIPDSTVWVAMSDGALLGLTYLKSQQVWGWHRHDTGANGKVESLCCIPEGAEDVVYMIVNRTINGATKRYVERLRSRNVVDVATDAFFVDSGLTYDGFNIDPSKTVTISGGTLWDNTESLTATAGVAAFVAGDVGNRIVLHGTVDQKFDIIGYTSSTVVTVRSVNNVGVEFRNTAFVDWSRAVDEVAGLSHLEGQAVSILADGYVVANGVDDPIITVTSGAVALGGLYSIVHVGLPIEADLETLSIDKNDQQSTILNKESLVTGVDIMVKSSRGIFAGPDANHLYEYKQRSDEDYGELTALTTGLISIGIDGTYDKGGRVMIRQRDPLPVTILSIIPKGLIGGG